MTANGIFQLAAVRGRPARAGQAAGRLHGPRLRGPAVRAGPRARLARAPDLSAVRRPARPRRWAGRPTRWPCCSSTSLGLLAVYLLQRLQGVLPLNPQGLGAVSPDSSFNTAVSFATNTNWQGYGGETTMSYLTQMLGLTVQNFVSAATGMADAGRAHPRLRAALGRDDRQLLGGPDPHARSTSCCRCRSSLALVLVSQGVVQTFKPYATAAVVQPTEYDEPVTDKDGKPVLDAKGQPTTKKSTLTEQVLAVGPAASQIAIKQLGTNGGGFFNVNSAHPFENPTPLSNFLELLSILRDPGRALLHVRHHGRRHPPGLGDPGGHDRDLRGAPRGAAWSAEQNGHPLVKLGVDHTASALSVGRQHGGQGGPLRHRQLGAVGHGDHRPPPTARSTPCTTPSRRSAAWCRCG